jgi:hypothetical protein
VAEETLVIETGDEEDFLDLERHEVMKDFKMRIEIGNYLIGIYKHGYLQKRASLLVSRIFFLY